MDTGVVEHDRGDHRFLSVRPHGQEYNVSVSTTNNRQLCVTMDNSFIR